MLDDWIADHGRDEGRRCREAARRGKQAVRFDRLAAELGHSLGLDPIGRVRLQAATAAAELTGDDLLQRLAKRGRSIREDAERRGVLTTASDDGDRSVVTQEGVEQPTGTDGDDEGCP